MAHVAVVGGGLAGSLAALVLRSRRPSATITILDAGKRSLGGRFSDGQQSASGAHFIRLSAGFANSPHKGQLAGLLLQLEGEGLLARWDARFGILGARGGFLPREVIGSSGVGAMLRQEGAQASEAGVDFCGLLRGGDEPRYVCMPSGPVFCERVCAAAGADVRPASRVTAIRHRGLAGGWSLDVAGADPLQADVLVLATSNAGLAASAVASIGSEGAADEASAAAEQRALGELRDSLEQQRKVRTTPVFSWSGILPPGASAAIPFDAAVAPGSSLVQLLVREGSKPGRPKAVDGGELWTGISTSGFAAELLQKEGAAGAQAAAPLLLTAEVEKLLAPFCDLQAAAPQGVSVKRWSAGFPKGSIAHARDCVALPPWQLAIAGDFVADHPNHAEAAALSGLAAGEVAAQCIVE